jgi:hypothetical protein
MQLELAKLFGPQLVSGFLKYAAKSRTARM